MVARTVASAQKVPPGNSSAMTTTKAVPYLVDRRLDHLPALTTANGKSKGYGAADE